VGTADVGKNGLSLVVAEFGKPCGTTNVRVLVEVWGGVLFGELTMLFEDLVPI
jgi:hypothetical protein